MIGKRWNWLERRAERVIDRGMEGLTAPGAPGMMNERLSTFVEAVFIGTLPFYVIVFIVVMS